MNLAAPNAEWTQLTRINDSGVVVGYYRVSGPRKGNEHAVVLTPAEKKVLPSPGIRLSYPGTIYPSNDQALPSISFRRSIRAA